MNKEGESGPFDPSTKLRVVSLSNHRLRTGERGNGGKGYRGGEKEKFDSVFSSFRAE